MTVQSLTFTVDDALVESVQLAGGGGGLAVVVCDQDHRPLPLDEITWLYPPSLHVRPGAGAFDLAAPAGHAWGHFNLVAEHRGDGTVTAVLPVQVTGAAVEPDIPMHQDPGLIANLRHEGHKIVPMIPEEIAARDAEQGQTAAVLR